MKISLPVRNFPPTMIFPSEDTAMTRIDTVLNEKKALLERYLEDLPRGGKNLLTESMAYSLGAGGKRLRPAIFLLTAELYGEDAETLLPFAAGIEMIHTYSLIHDDLPAMDNDDYRRGAPTNHKVYGEAQAILAGDGLLTEAFYMMASVGKSFPAERVVDAIALASELAGIGGMVRGQTFDVAGEGKPLTLRELKAIHDDKTAALIRLSLMSAALLAGAPVEDIDRLSDCGHALGLAFQIVDDILDHESTFEELGKPIGSDEEQGKTTYITLLGADGAREAAKEAAESAAKAAAALSVDGSLLAELAESLLHRKN